MCSGLSSKKGVELCLSPLGLSKPIAATRHYDLAQLGLFCGELCEGIVAVG